MSLVICADPVMHVVQHLYFVLYPGGRFCFTCILYLSCEAYFTALVICVYPVRRVVPHLLVFLHSLWKSATFSLFGQEV